MIDKELLDILACPDCKADVEEINDKIVCKKCGKKYPIKDGIPVMLIEEAQ
ncbi:MAG: Trm112 family protein [Candidatus Omnitrophota bacterium]